MSRTITVLYSPRLWAALAIAVGTGLCALALVAQAMQGDSAEGGLRFSHVLFG